MTHRHGPEPTAGDVDGGGNVDERLPKTQRLRKRREFLAVQNRGRKHHAKFLLVFTRPLDAAAAAGSTRRVGFTVSTKVGNAVVRNRVKRRLREVWRRHCGAMPRGLDVVLVAKRSAADASYQQLARELRDMAQRLSRAQTASGPGRGR